MNIVIVESPAKAKTVNKYLGPGYRVLASYGHVRDLPSKNGSVEPEKDFAMHWDVDPKAAKRLEEIAKAVKGANKLILATDPDREGEAISWHVLQVLDRKKALAGIPVERVVFNAVTKEAVLDAMRHPRTIDTPLVNAYLARRCDLLAVLWDERPTRGPGGTGDLVSYWRNPDAIPADLDPGASPVRHGPADREAALVVIPVERSPGPPV